MISDLWGTDAPRSSGSAYRGRLARLHKGAVCKTVPIGVEFDGEWLGPGCDNFLYYFFDGASAPLTLIFHGKTIGT